MVGAVIERVSEYGLGMGRKDSLQGVFRGGTLGSEGCRRFHQAEKGSSCEQRQDDERGTLRVWEGSSVRLEGGGCTASLVVGEEAEDMNQVSLQICLFKWAPHKHLLSEWVNERAFPQVQHIWCRGSRHGVSAWQQLVMRYIPGAVVQPISSKIVNFPKVQYLLGPRIRKHHHSVNSTDSAIYAEELFFYDLPSPPTFFHTILPFLIIIHFRLFWQLPLTSSSNILKLLFPGLSTFDGIYSFLWTMKKFVHDPSFLPAFFCPPLNYC